MTRGFVTLATGDIKYYKMAANMLKSFRLHNPNDKFAIACDKENEYTHMFDDVVLLDNTAGNYIDKFLLLIKAPYDESFFIEPDCLIYRNLDFFWDLLSKESDFSAFGWNDGGIECWFKTDEAKTRLTELIPEINEKRDAPLFNPGYFFIRKGEKCQKMYEDCIKFSEIISDDSVLGNDLSIMCNGKLRDDPIFNIAMLANGFVCHARPKEGKCIFLPSKYKINKIDIVSGELDVTDKNGKEFKNCALIHFSTRKVYQEGLYPWQCAIMNSYAEGRKTYKFINNSFFRCSFEIFKKISTVTKR